MYPSHAVTAGLSRPCPRPRHPPARTPRPPTRALLGTLAIAAALDTTACAPSAHQDAPTWQEATHARDDERPAHQAEAARSLGDPFVLVASQPDAPAPGPEGSGVTGDGPRSQPFSTWIMLESDACTVQLVSLHLAFETETRNGSRAWLSTAGPAAGRVLDASPRYVFLRYETDVRVGRNETGWLRGETQPATVDLQVEQRGEDVLLTTNITTCSPDGGQLHLTYRVTGELESNADVIPPRRLMCPH